MCDYTDLNFDLDVIGGLREYMSLAFVLAASAKDIRNKKVKKKNILYTKVNSYS